METIEEKIVECEQDLIQLKNQHPTTADSAGLHRLFFDFGSVQSTRNYRIVVAPVDGIYDDLIVMPVGSTGEIGGIISFPAGMGLDIDDPCVLHYQRLVHSDYPEASRSFVVYSNKELYIQSQTYT